MEQAGAVFELRFELDANFFSDFVAAAVNPGSNRGFQIAGARAEVAVHFAHTFFNDALDGAAPAGVEDANRVMFGVHQNHRKAIGGLDGEQQAGSGRDESVSTERFSGEPNRRNG